MDDDDEETYQRETTANSSKNELYESASQDVVLLDDLILSFTENLLQAE